MDIWLDTANISEIERWAWLIDGVTTNPSLLSKEGLKFREMVDRITNVVKCPVSVEATSDDADGMIREGREFSKWAPNIIVKIPMTAEGMKAVKALSRDGIKTNVTLVFSVSQAALAAKCGATYVSPFVGRVDDLLRKKAGMAFEKESYFPCGGLLKDGTRCDDSGTLSGVDLVRKILQAYKAYGMSTMVVAASIRNARQAAELMTEGSDVLTIPPAVLEKMFVHPKTDEGIESFRNDWAKVKK